MGEKHAPSALFAAVATFGAGGRRRIFAARELYIILLHLEQSRRKSGQKSAVSGPSWTLSTESQARRHRRGNRPSQRPPRHARSPQSPRRLTRKRRARRV